MTVNPWLVVLVAGVVTLFASAALFLVREARKAGDAQAEYVARRERIKRVLDGHDAA